MFALNIWETGAWGFNKSEFDKVNKSIILIYKNKKWEAFGRIGCTGNYLNFNYGHQKNRDKELKFGCMITDYDKNFYLQKNDIITGIKRPKIGFFRIIKINEVNNWKVNVEIKIYNIAENITILLKLGIVCKLKNKSEYQFDRDFFLIKIHNGYYNQDISYIGAKSGSYHGVLSLDEDYFHGASSIRDFFQIPSDSRLFNSKRKIINNTNGDSILSQEGSEHKVSQYKTLLDDKDIADIVFAYLGDKRNSVKERLDKLLLAKDDSFFPTEKDYNMCPILQALFYTGNMYDNKCEEKYPAGKTYNYRTYIESPARTSGMKSDNLSYGEFLYKNDFDEFERIFEEKLRLDSNAAINETIKIDNKMYPLQTYPITKKGLEMLLKAVKVRTKS